MKPITLVPIGFSDRQQLSAVATALSREYRVACSIANIPLDPTRTLHPERRQYHSTEILEMLAALRIPGRTLGVVPFDLYIPILSFVFGEAHLGGVCAVVSSHRLDETFYGLPHDPGTTRDRLVKCAIHEIGHTYGLVHCEDHACVMAAAHAVEWLDLKSAALCEECRQQCLRAQFAAAPQHLSR